MSELENIENKINEAKNELIKLEIDIQAVDSDSFYYQNNNEFEKLNELSNKKESLMIQYNAQKELVKNLENQLNSLNSPSEDLNNQKNNFQKQQEQIVNEEQEKKENIGNSSYIKNFDTKTCPHCNAKINKNLMFCPECGIRIIEETDDHSVFPKKEQNDRKKSKTTENMISCPKCYSKISKNTRFCPQCGYQINSIIVDPPSTPVNKNQGNKYIRIFMKKKNNDGTYRFSISKTVGCLYSAIVFFTSLETRGIIFGIFWAVISYLVFLIAGYIGRWIYNRQ